MTKLITVERAQKEINRLKRYIELVNSYETSTTEKWIIKEYAYTNSFRQVVKHAREKGYTYNGNEINKEFVSSVINSKPSDELHRILRTGYKFRIKQNKRKY
jgi:hypothetical protein